MKIGIYGGTFNPPHNGHITAAQAAVKRLGLEKLLLIPDKIPPHKVLPAGSADERQRYEMTVLASAKLGKLAEVTNMELRRHGKSYTSDTLRELHEQYPDDELYLLMGSDMFLSFETWHEPEVICSLARLAAFSRLKEGEAEIFAAQKRMLEQKYGAKVDIIVNENVIELSSTDVREALSSGKGKDLIPNAVYGYIRREHLYGTHSDLQHLTPDELRPIALSYLKPKRMPHVLGTEQEAVKLARMYGVDETKARVAALLHDCTKKLEMDEQLALCREYGIELDELEQKALKLLHSRTGAELARRVFGVDDEVYDAIRWHTTGRANMTKLEKILYLADYIEPSRDFDDVEPLRKVVYEDLDRGLLLGLQMTVEEMEAMGNPVHHHTLDARNYLMETGVTL